MSFVKLLAHGCLGAVFIFGGWHAFKEPGGRVEKVASAGIPRAREATMLNGALMVAGGSALALGIAPRLASLLLLGSLIPTTYVGHPFWQEDTPQGRSAQQTQFFKNLAMIGGLLLVLQGK